MRQLFRSTNVYRAFSEGARTGETAHFTLVLFPDAAYLRALLKECAKAFFAAEDGSREEKLIEAESFSDCLFYPAAGGKLSADLAGEITDESLLRPVEGEKKLFVLDAFHTVTPLVQNKLLKLLEEPPQGVYFLAGAAAEHAVLPTVLSRANVRRVPPFAEEAVEGALRRLHPGAEGVHACAAACGGVLSAAEALLAGGGEDFRLAEQFLSGKDLVPLCRRAGERGAPFFAAVRLVLRDVMFCAAGQERYLALPVSEVRPLAARYPAGAAAAALGFAAQSERELIFNANGAQAALTLALRIGKELEKWHKLS